MGNAIGCAPIFSQESGDKISASYQLSKTASKITSYQQTFPNGLPRNISNGNASYVFATIECDVQGGILILPPISGYIWITSANCQIQFSNKFDIVMWFVHNKPITIIASMPITNSINITTNGGEKFNFSFSTTRVPIPAGNTQIYFSINSLISGNTRAAANVVISSADIFKFYKLES